MENNRPKFHHGCKNSKFLGCYEDASGIYDLYFQNGQVVARFSSYIHDYLMAGIKLSSKIPAMEEAVKRAKEKGYNVIDETQINTTNFTTTELLAYADEEKKTITVYLTMENTIVKHLMKTNDDGSIIIIETPNNKKGKEIKTCTKEMLMKWPNSLGEIWQISSRQIEDDENE